MKSSLKIVLFSCVLSLCLAGQAAALVSSGEPVQNVTGQSLHFSTEELRALTDDHTGMQQQARAQDLTQPTAYRTMAQAAAAGEDPLELKSLTTATELTPRAPDNSLRLLLYVVIGVLSALGIGWFILNRQGDAG